MITIRKNVFETNSSSEHTLSLSPVEDVRSLNEESDLTIDHLRRNIKNGEYIIQPDRIYNLDFGLFTSFADKFTFVFVLMLLSKKCGDRLMTPRMWENDQFTISKANRIFNQTHKAFVKKLCAWMTDLSGKECHAIKIGTWSDVFEKNVKRCAFNINHQAMYAANEEKDYGLKIDPFIAITTFGMNIVYEFC